MMGGGAGHGLTRRLRVSKPHGRSGGGSLRPFSSEDRSMASAAENEETTAITAKFGKDQLKAFVERVERLEEKKKTIADDIRDVYAEAKANGFDVKTLRVVVRMR